MMQKANLNFSEKLLREIIFSVQQRGSWCSNSIVVAVLHAVCLDKSISNGVVLDFCAVISLILYKKTEMASGGQSSVSF